jgi:hypothetical protein
MGLTRRALLKTAGAAAAAAALGKLLGPARSVLPGAAAATEAWNHNPASPIGPPEWNWIPDVRPRHGSVSRKYQDRRGGQISWLSAALEVRIVRARC